MSNVTLKGPVVLVLISKLCLLWNIIRKCEFNQNFPINKYHDVRKTVTFCDFTLLIHAPVFSKFHPSRYVDHDGWLKLIIHLRNALGSTSWNHWVILFDRNNYQYSANLYEIMTSNFIYPLTLKAGDIKNDHTNDNRPNAAIGLVY